MVRCFSILVQSARLNLLAAAVVTAGGPSAWALPYRFRIIAEPGDVIEGRTITRFSPEDNPIAVNNHREVVFMASVDGPTNWSIMTPDRFIAGAGKVVDGVVPSFDNEDHRLSINDAGQVVYRGLFEPPPGADPGGRGAIFVNDQIVATYGTVIDGRRITGVDFRPAINNNGTVAFVATCEGHVGPALFTQDALIVERGQTIDGLTLDSLFGVQIHDSGTIAYSSGILGQNNVAVFTQDRLLVQSKENVPLGGPIIVHDVIDGHIIAGDITTIGISEGNEVAFWALIGSAESTIPLGQGLFTQDRLLVRSGSVIDGHTLLAFRGGQQFNERAMYSLLAEVPELGPPGLGEGLFVGGDFGAQFVVGTQSELFGRTVNAIHHMVAMNDRGDLVFLAHFEDGTSAVVMATVPESSTLLLCLVGVLTIWTLSARNRGRNSFANL